MNIESEIRTKRASIIQYKVRIDEDIATIEMSNDESDISSLKSKLGNLLVDINKHALNLTSKIDGRRKTIEQFQTQIERNLKKLIKETSSSKSIDIETIKKNWMTTKELIMAFLVIS